MNLTKLLAFVWQAEEFSFASTPPHRQRAEGQFQAAINDGVNRAMTVRNWLHKRCLTQSDADQSGSMAWE